MNKEWERELREIHEEQRQESGLRTYSVLDGNSLELEEAYAWQWERGSRSDDAPEMLDDGDDEWDDSDELDGLREDPSNV